MISGEKASRKILSYLLMLVSIFCICNVVYAGTVVIKPGRFDHFKLQMSDKAVAGENFVITVSAYDANKNLITNFADTGKEFKIDVSGAAVAQPSVIGTASFSGGLANVVINDKKSEKITFSIREAGGSVPVISREIIVSANKPDHFVVQAPASVIAGTSFDIKLAAKDVYDNAVHELDIAKSIKVTATGTSTVKILGNDTFDFKNGVASAAFVAEKSGDVVMDFVDIANGNRGKTPAIQVRHAGLAYFKLQAPRTGIAGEPIELLISAYDAFENIVTNYAAANSGVRLSATGSSKIEPATVNSSEFKNGQAVVKAYYDKAENIEIVARELNREQSGRTSEIAVSNTVADHFVVVTPDTGMSGQKFRIKVEAYDRFNNSVRNFNSIGSDVLLSSTGTGSLSPSRIAPSDFTNGFAVVDVIYDRAESFQISARGMADGSAGRVAVSDSNVRRDISRSPSKSAKGNKKTAEVIAPTSKKSESVKLPQDKTAKTKAAEVAVQKAQKKSESVKVNQDKTAKTADAKMPKPEVKKETAKTEKKMPPQEVKAAPAPEQKDRPVQKPSVPVKEAAPAKPAETKTDKTPLVTAKKTAEEPAKKDDKKIYNVSKVSIIESKNKAMLVVNITSPNGNLVYGDEIESRYGKEWLKLRIKPAISSTDKSFKFKSAYIGEVLVEEDKTGGQNQVFVYAELIPSGVTYDIARVKNTLVITLSHP